MIIMVTPLYGFIHRQNSSKTSVREIAGRRFARETEAERRDDEIPLTCRQEAAAASLGPPPAPVTYQWPQSLIWTADTSQMLHKVLDKHNFETNPQMIAFLNPYHEGKWRAAIVTHRKLKPQPSPIGLRLIMKMGHPVITLPSKEELYWASQWPASQPPAHEVIPGGEDSHGVKHFLQ